ncbi:MAG TPA: HEAT repeat domain-containing protein [Polyangiaceae bacterium]|nr:HEAT repeat domain-containing protein [Polyangiaceae bacterium]
MRAPRPRRVRALAALAALAGALGAAGGARAQGGRAPAAPRGELRERFGVEAAERLLASPKADERLRGVERLSASGSPRALDALVKAFEPGGGVATDARARLLAVRALGPHLDAEAPRQVVLDALQDGSLAARGNALGALVRDTAAFVLARSGPPSALEALVRTVRYGGDAGRAARAALLAHRPARIDQAIGARTPLSAPVVELAGALGDRRLVPFVRRALREGDVPTRAAALVALAELGSAEAAPVARSWAREGDPAAQLAAARALALVEPAQARPVVARLLAREAARREALEIAEAAPGPELAAALEALAGAEAGVELEARERAVALLGRVGDARSSAALERLFGHPQLGPAAAFALAQAPSGEAGAALERALKAPPTRALALRAAVARARSLDETPRGLEAALAEARRGDPTQRAAATFADVALGRQAPDAPGPQASAQGAGAAARGALARGGAASAALVRMLERQARDPVRRAAAAAGLAESADGAPLPSQTLRAWALEDLALTPLCLRALATRDEEADRRLLDERLRSEDARARLHVAAGLGASPNPDATGRLAAAYAFETDPLVRRALVRSLTRRGEEARLETLRLAADLDPDDEVRAAARAALKLPAPPAKPAPPPPALDWARARAAPGSAPVALHWVRPDGLTLPVIADPDGLVVMPGSGPGQARLEPVAVGQPVAPPGAAPDERGKF